VNGLYGAVQGFKALEQVEHEVLTLKQLYAAAESLLEAAFSSQALNNKLRNSKAEIVHIASHAKFESQFTNTFILTYHDRITMPRLRNLLAINQFREQPIDLLFLGACQTAQGNARAAFGLAGVGLHSGAKSVVGTLWLVDDGAAAQLSTAFHQFLQQGAAKSIALQKAQQAVFKNRDDPYYWAAHTLIGY
jgi:CHAT domain-containing protein